MMGVWFGVYRAGYNWNGTPDEQFSYHPLFMFVGLVFLYGNGIRSIIHSNRPIPRTLHILWRAE